MGSEIGVWNWQKNVEQLLKLLSNCVQTTKIFYTLAQNNVTLEDHLWCRPKPKNEGRTVLKSGQSIAICPDAVKVLC